MAILIKIFSRIIVSPQGKIGSHSHRNGIFGANHNKTNMKRDSRSGIEIKTCRITTSSNRTLNKTRNSRGSIRGNSTLATITTIIERRIEAKTIGKMPIQSLEAISKATKEPIISKTKESHHRRHLNNTI
jgi:hypothetical protein